ncbi:phage tail protein [Escherichia coli]|nr:phage tail protein [Escherichia coli]HAX2345265.1 phage tail protein [Escherichia coli]HBN7237007.1 phage tail protein [Escherichia coli]HBN7443542.1 phage tail protein [Escherichia coli]HBQ4879981.1 phage tail protein [Escherichia coli]
MERQSFEWHPDYESEKTIKPNVTVLRFGDDYEQRQAKGLNRIKEEWSLSFTGEYKYIHTIDDFLTERGAIESFNWTTPRGKKIVVVCDSHSVKRYKGYCVLTASFRQVFEA